MKGHVNWGDHFENRLELDRAENCHGLPSYEGGSDQRAWCADGCVNFNNGDFHLPVGKLAEFVATLYEAAGKPAPIVLERPEVTANGFATPLGTIYPFNSNGGILIGVTGKQTDRFITSAEARDLAAVLGAHADLADAKTAANEPDPAEVEELTQRIARDLRRVGGPDVPDEIAARSALRWMRERQASS